jgi:hypothetical protein
LAWLRRSAHPQKRRLVMKAGTIVKKASVDLASGKLADWLTKQSSRGVYNVMVFDTGEEVAVPEAFRTSFDLVIGAEYSARWADGKLTLKEGIVDLSTEADAESESEF